jgi:hypothetical protein
MGVRAQIQTNYTDCAKAASDLGLSTHRVAEMCRIGVFATAFKAGFGRKAEWRILRSEITAHKINGHRVTVKR